MTIGQHMAKHIREVYAGGNWTASNLKAQIEDVQWQEANKSYKECNTIASLVYHLHYYVHSVLKVLQGGPLESKDALSFDHPPITSQFIWEQFIADIFQEMEAFAQAIEEIPNSQMDEYFVEEKYGSYYRNLQGVIEHTHYHLGQIVILKKCLRS